MKSETCTIGILGLLVICWLPLQAQKDIELSDSLSLNAEKLKVKMGTQWFGKIWKFSFGDYAVRSSKMGWGVTSSRSNFFNTKTESKSTQKFSFAMRDGDNNTAHVNAAENIKIKEVERDRGAATSCIWRRRNTVER